MQIIISKQFSGHTKKNILYFPKQSKFFLDDYFSQIVQPKVHKLYRFHHNWLHHLNLYLTHCHPHQVLTAFFTDLEVRLYCKLNALFLFFQQPNILMVANIFHSLAKNAVVHNFENVVLKPVGCLGSQSCVQISISFEPCTLLNLDLSVHSLNH